MPRYDLTGRTVLITGSTGGLGSGLAAELRRRGANLALLDLDTDRTTQQAAELGGDTVARGWAVDVRDLDSVRSATDAAAAHFGRLDVVIANAGIGEAIAPMTDLSSKEWERTVDINLNGVWRTFTAALPHVTKERGHLLAISSLAAFVHAPLQGGYTASKAGVWALCDTLRLEVAHTGVTVGSAHPTFFKTPLMDGVMAQPASMRIWNNHTGMWKLIPIETVVNEIVRGIERRAAHVVAPRSNQLAAYIPGVIQTVADRMQFRHKTVQEALAAAQ
ncbi:MULTISPECIES: SDR family NAD(P)-dependent oxidoreductase [unclassified Streptomyces]|uniref:SDR family NAD(P)-dependent oxidoreductase n=1 Tax=unclassified Streptomyces TaxID=2593676 RepID=UPI0037F18079